MEESINERLWEFLLSGGIFMAFIIACSFVAVTVSIYRFLTVRWNAVVPKFLSEEWNRCEKYFAAGHSLKLLAALRKNNTPFARIGQVVMSPDYENRGEASEAVEATAREEMVKLEGGMNVLEVVITIAPLLGLLGTVSGLVNVFANLGESGAESDPSLIAGGIAKALNTTIAGLVVAVITVIFHSIFTRRLENMAARLEVMSSQLLHKFYKHGGPALYQKEREEFKRAESEKQQAAAQPAAGGEASREVGGSEFLP